MIESTYRRFRSGRDVEWYIARVWEGGHYDLWDSAPSKRAVEALFREKYKNEGMRQDFAVVKMTLERLPAPKRVR